MKNYVRGNFPRLNQMEFMPLPLIIRKIKCKTASILLAIPFASLTTAGLTSLKPSEIIFELQINDPLISSSSNAAKLNALLGNTSADPTLVAYLSSPSFVCPFVETILSKGTRTWLTKNLQEQCRQNESLKPYLSATFSKGERYEDLKVIKFRLLTKDPDGDQAWIKKLTQYYTRRASEFSQTKIQALARKIATTEQQSRTDLTNTRLRLTQLISSSGGSLDETYKIYSNQLSEFTKLRVSYDFEKSKNIAVLAAKLGVSPKQASQLVDAVIGLNNGTVKPLLTTLNTVTVKLAKLRASSSTSNPEYIQTMQVRLSLIRQISRIAPGFASIVNVLPNLEDLPTLVQTASDLKALDYRIADNKELSRMTINRIKAVSSSLPEYTVLTSKLSAQQKALESLTEDNEALKIELTKAIGNWDLISGPYISRISFLIVAAVLFILYASTFLLLFNFSILRSFLAKHETMQDGE